MVQPFSVPLPMGYCLERCGVTCAAWPEVPYRGIDRLPFFGVEPDGNEWQKREIARLDEAYDDAEESGAHRCDPVFVERLRSGYCWNGLQLETVWAELTAMPVRWRYHDPKTWEGTLDWAVRTLLERKRRLGARPEGMQCLGYDIASPYETFHSAIFQPGLDKIHKDLPRFLNPDGLFSELDVALRFLDEANLMGYGPFCVIQVWLA
jgi:hypothetical protein